MQNITDKSLHLVADKYQELESLNITRLDIFSQSARDYVEREKKKEIKVKGNVVSKFSE